MLSFSVVNFVQYVVYESKRSQNIRNWGKSSWSRHQCSLLLPLEIVLPYHLVVGTVCSQWKHIPTRNCFIKQLIPVEKPEFPLESLFLLETALLDTGPGARNKSIVAMAAVLQQHKEVSMARWEGNSSVRQDHDKWQQLYLDVHRDSIVEVGSLSRSAVAMKTTAAMRRKHEAT